MSNEVQALLQTISENDVSTGKAVSEATLSKIAQTVTYLAKNSLDIIGETKITVLTEAQFAQAKDYEIFDTGSNPIPENQKKWVLYKGQDISGSDLANLTGINSLADMVSKEAHIAQALNDAALMSYQENQNKSHQHNVTYVGGVYDELSSNSADFMRASSASDYTGPQNNTKTTTAEGGAVARPNRVMHNLFIKINN